MGIHELSKKKIGNLPLLLSTAVIYFAAVQPSIIPYDTVPVISSEESPYYLIRKWDFENRTAGQYTEEMAREDFQVYNVFLHENESRIEEDPFHGKVGVAVIPATSEDDMGYNGWQINAYFDEEHTSYDEIYVSYYLKFSENIFNRNLRGKLPGIRGMPAVHGGDHSGEGFYYAPMHMSAELLGYHYDRTGKYWPWGTEPGDMVNHILFRPGIWYRITQRVTVNSFTGGMMNPDGVNEIWVNGIPVIQEKNLYVLQDEDKSIDGIFIGAFLNGDPRPEETKIYFDDITVWIPLKDPVTGSGKLHDKNYLMTDPFFNAE
jgi:hypothetical protein